MPTQTDLVGPALSRGRSLDRPNQQQPRFGCNESPCVNDELLIGCEQHAGRSGVVGFESSSACWVVVFVVEGTSCRPRARLSSFSYCAARMPTSLATICTTFNFAVAVLTAPSLLPSPLQQLLPAVEPGSSPAVKYQVPAPATLGHCDLPATIGASLHIQFIEDALSRPKSK